MEALGKTFEIIVTILCLIPIVTYIWCSCTERSCDNCKHK